MKTLLSVMMVLVLAFTIVHARDTDRPALHPVRAVSDGEFEEGDIFAIDQGVRDRFISAQVDTYCIVWYDFEQMNWQGWTRVDATAQRDTFFHVDDFEGLDGGDYGKLVPIEGAKSMWFGFSMMYMREAEPFAPMMRYQVVRDIVTWMENPVNSTITEVDYVPAVNSLSQNFPNPFNPATRIEFSLRTKGHVSITIYDVAGRLVKTLVDEVYDAGRYEVIWDGTDNHASKVASSVYFYRMNTLEFERTMKMVLLR